MASIFNVPRDLENLVAEQQETNVLLDRIDDGQDITNALLKDIRYMMRQFMPPKNPIGSLVFVSLSRGVSGMKYKVTLPQLPDGDTNNADAAKGLLRQTYNGVPQPAVETAIGQTTIEELEIPSGTTVDADFVFADAAGNVSVNPVATVSFTVPDTVPPPSPVGDLVFEPIG